MDPIVAAVIAALPALAATTVSGAVKDAYAGLKAVIHRKWGKHSEVAKSLDDLQKMPTSEQAGQVFERQVHESGAQQDEEFREAVIHLTRALNQSAPQSHADSSFTQVGGNFKGVGVIGNNVGDLHFD